MKINKIYIAAFLCCLIFFSSCEKDYDNFITKVTYYADIDYEPFVVIPVGGSYTAQATATEAGEELDVTIVGAENVDPNKIGIYEVTYSAVNSDGYPGSVTQIIVVHNPDGVGTDVSGAIYDINHSPDTNGRNGVISLVEGTSNMYHCTDFGGNGVLPLYFEMNGDEMNVVDQPIHYSTVQSAEGSYNPVDRTFSVTFDTGWSYVFAYSPS